MSQLLDVQESAKPGDRETLPPEVTPDKFALVFFDPEGRILRQSPGAEQVIGNVFADLVTPASASGSGHENRSAGWFHDALRGDFVVARDLVFELGNGYTATLAVSAAPAFDRDGDIMGVSAMFVDVGALRRTEEAQQLLSEAGRVLASSLDYDTTISEAVGLFIPRLADWCVIFVRERDDTIRLASIAHSDPVLAEAMQRLFEEYHPTITESGGIGEVIRTGSAALRFEADELLLYALRTFAPEQIAQLKAHGSIGGMLLPLQSRGHTLGAILFVSRHLLRQHDPADAALAEELSRRVATALDNARLYAAARAAIVAHDLRNPVGTIQMTTDLLMDETFAPEERTKYYGIIRRASDRMKRLIQDLLDVTSIDAGRLTVDLQPLDVAMLLDDVREMFAAETAEKLQRLEFDVPPALPVLAIDRERMLQVFSNLIGNAVKFTPEGGLIAVRVASNDRVTRFVVTDTGPGIAADEVEHVFDRFWQSRRARRGGAGLGLAIAKGIVEAHGGTIDVASVPGEGTTFTFTVPLDRPDVEGAVLQS